MGWVLRLVETGTDSLARDVEVMEIARPGTLGDIANLVSWFANSDRFARGRVWPGEQPGDAVVEHKSVAATLSEGFSPERFIVGNCESGH